MIQKTQGRRLDSAGLYKAHYTKQGDSLHWGQWFNDKYYSLEVAQHPMRARMCGFGDKDRRPIAPAAVAKMIVKDKYDKEVPVGDTDAAFFVVTVDLWSEDGMHETNLVLHPNSANSVANASHATAGKQTKRSNPARSSTAGGDSDMSSPAIQANSFAHPSPEHRGSFSSQSGTDISRSANKPLHAPFPLSQSWSSSGANNTSLPPFSSLDMSHGRTAQIHQTVETRSVGPGVKPWGDEGYLQGGQMYNSHMQSQSAHYPPPPTQAYLPIDPLLHPPHSYQPAAATAPFQSGRGPAPQLLPDPPSYSNSHSSTPSIPRSPGPQSQPPHKSFTSDTEERTHNTNPSHTYTRTLVGPLSANASKLQDQHRQMGIFFLFQDLSVRTEGAFRLRFRLMSVGAQSQPEWASPGVTTTFNPILAQTFTEPFVVYSAKRFPGVPDTTALSIAFGNQGQKLPLRNRNGPSAPGGRRKRKKGSDDDDSDDG